MTRPPSSPHSNDPMPPRPWYRQFWPWFLIALPMTAVIGGIVTVIIAVRTADQLVTSMPPAAPVIVSPESDA